MTTWLDAICRESVEWDKPILSTLQADYTLREIEEETRRYITMLMPLGSVRRKKIGILVPSVRAFAALSLAANQLGAVLLPISTQFRREDLSQLLETFDPHIVFTVNRVGGFDAAAVVQAWASSTGKRTVIFTTADCMQWDSATTGGSERPAEAGAADVIGCSSGSTGTPKGIMVDADFVLNNGHFLVNPLELERSDRVFSLMPISGLFGLSLLLMALYHRIRLVAAETYDFPGMLRRMEQLSCNKLAGTPSLLKALYLFADSASRTAVNGLEVCMLAGENMTELDAKALSGLRAKLRSVYGLSELGPLMYTDDVRHGFDWKVIPTVSYKVEADGEIAFRADHGFIGYYQQPELTRTVKRDGWFYTGDLVQHGENGQLRIAGRKKDLIKKGGQQVMSGEVESMLLRHPHIVQTAIVGVPHAVYGEQIAAFIVADKQLHEHDVHAFLKARIAAYKVPDMMRFVDQLPTAQGKIDKIALRRLASQPTKELKQ